MLRAQRLSGDEIRLRVERLLGQPQPLPICGYCLSELAADEVAFFVEHVPARPGPTAYAAEMLGFPDVETFHESCTQRFNPYRREYW